MTKTEALTNRLHNDGVSVPEEAKKETNDVMDLNNGEAFDKNVNTSEHHDVKSKISPDIYGNVQEEITPMKDESKFLETFEILDKCNVDLENGEERAEFIFKNEENRHISNVVDKDSLNENTDLTDPKGGLCDKTNEQAKPLVFHSDTYIAEIHCNRKNTMCSSFMQQFELFKSKVFVMFVISQFMFFIGFYQPFFYIPDKAKQSGK